MRPRSFVVLVLAGPVIAACSSGGQVGATFSSNVGGAGGASGPGASGAGASGPSSSTAQASSAASSAQASSAASSSSSTGGMGAGCDYPNDCAGALQLTDINGDKGSDLRTVSGSTPKWFKLFVNDYKPTFGNSNESYTATLTSPPGLQFDLLAYDGNATMPDCFAAALQGSGSPKVISDAWPDGNGDDSRWITFEVRYISGPACDGSAKWTLTVEGHTGG